MVFSSVEFLLGFLPIFLVIYYLTPVTGKNIILFLGSLFFYAYGEPKYILLLLLSIVLNYFFGRILAPEGKLKKPVRRICFIGILSANVGMLALFKWAPENWGLPLGVSFYTFQIISYLADVYRGDIEPEPSFIKLGTYVSMFPQLVAGPIVNYSEVSENLKEPKVSLKDMDAGLKTFVWGLVMKVLIADRLSILWNEISTIGYISISTPLAWMGAISYSMQIYFDFYGYSLMAIGLGRMLGFELPLNFNMPYMAKSIREFYRRWHMTLGRWFTRYVYIPLGGSRKGMLRTLGNLLLVWVLTSLWHGGSINFLIWGMVLCFFIILEKIIDHLITRSRAKIERGVDNNKKADNEEEEGKTTAILPEVFKHLYVLLVIPVTWMCFAISKTDELLIYLGRMFGLTEGININEGVFGEKCGRYGLIMLMGAFLCTPLGEKLFQKGKDRIWGMVLLAGLFWLCVWYIMTMGDNPFMYFRF